MRGGFKKGIFQVFWFYILEVFANMSHFVVSISSSSSYWKLLSKIPLILFLFHLLSGSLRLGKLVLQMLHTVPESCFQLLKHETPSNFAQVFSSCTFPPTKCMHFSTLSCISSICLVPFATLIAFIIRPPLNTTNINDHININAH